VTTESKEAQDALRNGGLLDILSGKEITLTNLQDLRRYVVYPTNQELREKNPEALGRRYLAVKDVEIYCHFDDFPVDKLALVDLPGLGEAGPSAFSCHLEGLENDVDHIIFVFRPVTTKGFIGGTALDDLQTLYSIQRGQNEFTGFISILVNVDENGQYETETESLCDEITRKINNGVENSRHKVRRVCIKKEDDLNNAFEQILGQMVSSLPVIDENAYQSAVGTQGNLFGDILAAAKQIRDCLDVELRQINDYNQGAHTYVTSFRINFTHYLENYAHELLRSIELDETVEKLKPIEEMVRRKVGDIHASVESRIKDGFFQGSDRWKKNAQRGIGPRDDCDFVKKELHRIRTAIANSYEGLNDCYSNGMEVFLNEILSYFNDLTGSTLADASSGARKTIDEIISKMKKVKGGNPRLEQAFKWLYDVDFSFRQDVFPGVRGRLQQLDAYYPGRKPSEDLLTDDVKRKLRDGNPIESSRNYLAIWSHEANSSVKDEIDKNRKHFVRYLYSAVEYFIDNACHFTGIDDEYFELYVRYHNSKWENFDEIAYDRGGILRGARTCADDILDEFI
jgi:hypothetical protein